MRSVVCLLTCCLLPVSLCAAADPDDPGSILTAEDRSVPQQPVTARDYYEYSQGYQEHILPNPGQHGRFGPRHGLPALAAYRFSGERRYAEALLVMLRAYDRWIRDYVAGEGEGTHWSWEGPYLCGLILRELRQDGLLTAEDEDFFREMLIFLAEHLTSHNAADQYNRGAGHRPLAEAGARGLAVFWYPDIPQAAAWQRYFDIVWDDWWRFRDLDRNDTGYLYGSLERIILVAELMGRTEVFTDPQMQPFWERIMYEVASDGSNVPYGASYGWNSHAGSKILALELAARYTRDGRYRWAAHRILHYLWERGEGLRLHHTIWANNLENIALAALLADDTVAPVPPDPGSRVLHRKEALRYTTAEAKRLYPGYGPLSANIGMTQRIIPHKVILRSGWEPGDLYMMVEAYTRHDPLNPTAILGFVRHGSTQAIMVSEKWTSRENLVQIEDPTHAATYCGRHPFPGERRLPLGYAGMECEVELLADSPLATYARLQVTGYMGYEVEQTRELVFVKNRWVLVRDRSRFLEGFPVRIGPVWNTQQLAAQGPHWFSCYFDQAIALPPAYCENPRWDLLVYHRPAPDRQLVISEREEEPLIQATAPYSTRYVWEGEVAPGRLVHFNWLLVPHSPAEDAAALADGITFLRDTPDLTAVRVLSAPAREEWVVLNDLGTALSLTGDRQILGVSTDARRLYVDCNGGEVARYWAGEAGFLEINETEIFRSPNRRDVSRGQQGEP